MYRPDLLGGRDYGLSPFSVTGVTRRPTFLLQELHG